MLDKTFRVSEQEIFYNNMLKKLKVFQWEIQPAEDALKCAGSRRQRKWRKALELVCHLLV